MQQTLRHLQKAFTNFWAQRAKYPRFKKKRSGGSAEFTRSAFKWKDGQLWLAKCSEPLPIRWSRQLPRGCKPSTVTIRLDGAGRWFVSLLINDSTIKTLPFVEQAVGLDAGISSLVTTNDGEYIVNPKHFNRKYKKLRRAQKTLSRRQKADATPRRRKAQGNAHQAGSKNRDKARQQVARIQAQIADARKDFLHKLTTRLVRENQTIAALGFSCAEHGEKPQTGSCYFGCGVG